MSRRGKIELAIEHIHTYLVHPGKGSAVAPRIGGTAVALEGKLFHLLSEIYADSDRECDTDISFNQSQGHNLCRDLIIEYLRGPTIVRGRHLAARLERVTTYRSGLGLLFLIAGHEGRDSKIVISRFPADSAILAEEDQQNLTVEFLERVFMRSATAYKAAAYQGSSLTSGFWIGKAVDKQINNPIAQLSNYWIAEFLDSDFRTTSVAGTRRLALALRDAVKNVSDVSIKSEISAAVTLAHGLSGRRLSVRDFGSRFGLSEAAMQAISAEIKPATLADERFQFNVEEFRKQITYRSVELDSGGMLTALSTDFDDVFQRELLDAAERKVRYSTEGKVVGESLRRTR